MLRNIFGTITAEPTRSIREHLLAGVVDAVRQAESTHARIRAAGSAWSSTDVFVSDESLLEGRHLAGLPAVFGPGIDTRGLRGDAWLPLGLSPAHRQRYFARVDAGRTVNEVYKWLDRHHSLTLPVMGGASGQTILGAISTGTHGGDVTARPIADTVYALTLVGPGGKVHWVEREGDAALTREGWVRTYARAQGIDEVHQNDEIFAAALTAVGCLGIVTSAVLQVVPQFYLMERITDARWSSVRRAMRSNQILTTRGLRGLGVQLPDDAPLADLEVLLNPYSRPFGTEREEWWGAFLSGGERRAPTIPGGRDREVALVTRSRHDYGDNDAIPPRPEPSFGLQVAVVNTVPSGPLSGVAQLVTAVMKSTRFTTTRPYRAAYLRDTYSGSGRLSPGATSEICISTADDRHIALIDDLLDSFDDYVAGGHWFSGFFSIRFQRPSRALMAMQHSLDPDGPHICHIEVQSLIDVGEAVGDVVHLRQRGEHTGDMQGRNDEFMFRFEQVARRHRARMHWGQLNLLTRAAVETAYSSSLHRFRRVRTRLSKSGSGRTFSSDFSDRVGLETYGDVLAFCRTGANQYDLYGCREDGSLAYLRWDGQDWRQPERIENPFASLPRAGEPERCIGPLTAAAYPEARSRAFGIGLEGHLLMVERPSGTVVDLNDGDTAFRFGSPISACVVPSDPAVTFLFGIAPEGRILFATDEGGAWTVDSMDDLDGRRCYGRIVTTCSGPDRIDIFGRSRGGAIVHGWRTRGTWQSALLDIELPGRLTIASPIACTHRGPDRLDVFGLTELGQLVRIRNNGSGWRTFVHSPPARLGTSRRRASLAQTQLTREDAPHFQHVAADLPNSFSGELVAVGEPTSSPSTDKVHVLGLGRWSSTGTRRGLYRATFVGDRLDRWERHAAPFWST